MPVPVPHAANGTAASSAVALSDCAIDRTLVVKLEQEDFLYVYTAAAVWAAGEEDVSGLTQAAGPQSAVVTT